MSKPTVAIVIALNDIDKFHGGSRNGIKSEISYFDQFLILYHSIIENWKKNNFDYYFVLIHSKNFSEEKYKILKKLDLKIMQVEYEYHDLKIRPLCYSIPLDCDFRLVLDVDMLAIEEPNFDFTYDAQAMYGGNKYNKRQWKEICKAVNCELPNYKILRWKKGGYDQWTFYEHYLYNIGKKKKKIFPCFNNGAILIKNELSPEFFKIWEALKFKYTLYMKSKFKIDIDLEGQDIVGLAIDQVAPNWNVFMKGMNFILQDEFDLGVKLFKNYKGKFYLLHYINVQSQHPYYKILKNEHLKVKTKYY